MPARSDAARARIATGMTAPEASVAERPDSDDVGRHDVPSDDGSGARPRAPRRRGGRAPEESAATAEGVHGADTAPAPAMDRADPASDAEATTPEELLPHLPLTARVEAVLLTADRPLSDGRLAALLGLHGKGAPGRLRDAVDAINRSAEDTGRAFRIERLAGGWRMLTRPEFGPLHLRQQRDRQQSRLSNSAIETLAIIAYRQPVLRAEIEAIRGVACGEVLRGLMERRLIRIAGRAEELGRPMLYGTTREFLKVFGLASLDDLPVVAAAPADRPRVLPAPADTGAAAPARPDPPIVEVSRAEPHATGSAADTDAVAESPD